MIGRGRNRTVNHGIGVVILTAAKRRGMKTLAKFHALDGGDGEQCRSKLPLQPPEEWPAVTGRQPGNLTFDGAADRIALCGSGKDLFAHFLALVPIQHRQLTFRRCCRCHGVKGRIVDGADACNMGRDTDAAPLQQLERDPTRHTQRSRQTAREVSPARGILITAVFELGRIVRMARSRHVAQRLIIRRARIAVFDHRTQRCAAGDVIDKPG